MSPEEALDILYKGIAPNPTANNECIELCKKALAKQIPKKPARDKEGCLVCGNCGSFEGIRIDTSFNEGFCWDCGQAIDLNID